MNRKDFQRLSALRLKEAKALLGYFHGAYYLTGYAAECALKACIAKRTQKYNFPDKHRTADPGADRANWKGPGAAGRQQECGDHAVQAVTCCRN